MSALFDRCNVFELDKSPRRAHGGRGEIAFRRIAEAAELGGSVNFIDVAELEPGVTIGLHRHADDEEEYYLVLCGSGRMVRDGVAFSVRAGDLIRTGPGGRHQLENDGRELLRLFVFEVKATR